MRIKLLRKVLPVFTSVCLALNPVISTADELIMDQDVHAETEAEYTGNMDVSNYDTVSEKSVSAFSELSDTEIIQDDEGLIIDDEILTDDTEASSLEDSPEISYEVETEQEYQEFLEEYFAELEEDEAESRSDEIVAEDMETEESLIIEDSLETNSEILVDEFGNELEPEIEYSEVSGRAVNAGNMSAPMRKLRSGGTWASGSVRYGDQLEGGESDVYNALISNWGNGGSDSFIVTFSTPITFTVEDTNAAEYKESKAYLDHPDYIEFHNNLKAYLQAGLDAFLYDRPDVFWFTRVQFQRYVPSFKQNSDGSTTVIIRGFGISNGVESWTGSSEQIETFNSIVDSTVTELTPAVSAAGNNAAKAKILSNYLLDKCTYKEGTYAHSSFGVFCGGGRVVCEGYAKAYKVLCDRFGIPCILVCGDALAGNSLEPHMWNYVKLDAYSPKTVYSEQYYKESTQAGWYLVDVTWNDGSSGPYSYLYLGSDTVPAKASVPISSQRKLYHSFSESSISKAFTMPDLVSEMYHEYELTEKTDPSCEEDGHEYIGCSIHEHEEVVDTPAYNHDYDDEWFLRKEATCAEDGIEYRTCKRESCGHEETRPIPKHTEHDNLVWEDILAEHACEEGRHIHKCLVCGEIVTSEVIPATQDHSFSEWEEDIKETCVTPGREKKICSTCGKTEYREIPATGIHQTGEWIIEKEATCIEKGSMVKRCVMCEKIMESDEIPVSEIHAFGEWKIERSATCTEDGEKSHVCTVCGLEEKETIPSAGGHTESEWVITKEPSCIEEGERVKTCTVCGETLETEKLPISDNHVYGEWVIEKEALCTTTGEKARTCTLCEHVERDVIPATGIHNSGSWVVTKPATCNETGVQAKKCTICGMVVETEIIPKSTKHEYGQWVTKKVATCSSAGTKEHICSICGAKESAVINATSSHTEGNWIITKTATCKETGLRIKKCTVCGKTLVQETIAKTESHKPAAWKTIKAAGCTASGLQTRYCSVCSKEVARRSIPAAGHKYSAWKTTKSASINASGIQERVCQVCKHKETKTVAKIKPFISVPKSISVVKGSTVNIKASFAAGDSIKKWATNKKSVATVSNGKVTGKKVGSCKITVQLKSGKSATISVKVTKPTTTKLTVKASGLRNNTITVKKGKTVKLTVTKTPKNSADKIKYTSSNNKIATVSSSGKIKGIKKGTVKITIKSGKVTKTITVKVL